MSAKQRTEKQFAEWMQAHSSIALKIARSFERSVDSQADLLQEILLQWWRSIPRYPAGAPAAPWLYRVSLHVALTWQRRESRRSRLIDHHAIFSELIATIPQSRADDVAGVDLADLYRRSDNSGPRNVRSSSCTWMASRMRKSQPPQEFQSMPLAAG